MKGKKLSPNDKNEFEGPTYKDPQGPVKKSTKTISGGKKFAGKMFDGPDLSGGGWVRK